MILLNNMRRAAKVDRNQNDIVKALRKIGCCVLITSQLKDAFDILVGYRSKLFIMEIKDGTLAPSKRKLTPGEEKCMRCFEGVGVKYHTVLSIDHAIEIVTA